MTMTREEAIKELELIAQVTMWNDRREAVEMAIEALKDRPQGEWIDSKTAKGYVVCSNCNKLTTNINRKKYNYCPFCGAEICKGGDDE